MTIQDVARVVRGYRFTYATEAQLQDGIVLALEQAGHTVEREHVLTGGDGRLALTYGRIDLLVDERIGVEVKIAGSATEVAAQLRRYLDCPHLVGIVLVSGKASHAGLEHPRLEVVSLAGQL